jgi:hypothetical protein
MSGDLIKQSTERLSHWAFDGSTSLHRRDRRRDFVKALRVQLHEQPARLFDRRRFVSYLPLPFTCRRQKCPSGPAQENLPRAADVTAGNGH